MSRWKEGMRELFRGSGEVNEKEQKFSRLDKIWRLCLVVCLILVVGLGLAAGFGCFGTSRWYRETSKITVSDEVSKLNLGVIREDMGNDTNGVQLIEIPDIPEDWYLMPPELFSLEIPELLVSAVDPRIEYVYVVEEGELYTGFIEYDKSDKYICGEAYESVVINMKVRVPYNEALAEYLLDYMEREKDQPSRELLKDNMYGGVHTIVIDFDGKIIGVQISKMGNSLVVSRGLTTG